MILYMRRARGGHPVASRTAILPVDVSARASHTPILSVEVSAFRPALLRWFDQNKRSLPWRASKEPYRIWLSEIMLQQTRVAAVVPYYERFLARFPDVGSLARAREASVLAAWSGLGYYRRARNLHAAAREVARRGGFPRTSSELRELPGIGRYTAAAIASIAFGERCAAVDGNVERVIARITGSEFPARSAWDIAEALLSRTRPGDFNQAMMELGATVCTPKAPQCGLCPLARFCRTRGEHATRKLAPRTRQTLRYVLLQNRCRVLLVQRSPNASVMPGMWELPVAFESATNNQLPKMRLRHSIMNTDYEVLVFTHQEGVKPTGKWVQMSRLAQLPLTGLARKILRAAADSGGELH